VALFAGDDGLDAYREIVPAARDWLVSGGWLVLEIGHDQGDAVRRMLEQNRFKNIEIRQDLALLDRIALGQK
jgi:release factor glutamine methyltransferase